MRTLISTICIFYLCVSSGATQSLPIDNHSWQIVVQENVQFRVPDTWEFANDSWGISDNSLEISISNDDSNSFLDRFSVDTIIEEDIDLPIGQAVKITASNGSVQAQIYHIGLPTQNLLLTATITIDSSETEQEDFFAIVAQIANTLQSNLDNDATWSLAANTDANIFLRMPLSWSKQVSDDNTVSVSQLFDDVLLSVTYRDLGRPFELTEVSAQFATIYASNSYDIQVQAIVNLPIGDALYFQLGDVRVTSSSTHIQLHYAIAHGNYLIVVTAGADESYFSEYENTLRQMMDTIVFEMP